MHHELANKIQDNPRFKDLVKRRSRFAWIMSIIVLIVYYSYILVIAFKPEVFATPINDTSVISIGIPIGAGIILFAFLMTGIYTRRANKDFDEITDQIRRDTRGYGK